MSDYPFVVTWILLVYVSYWDTSLCASTTFTVTNLSCVCGECMQKKELSLTEKKKITVVYVYEAATYELIFFNTCVHIYVLNLFFFF